MSALGKKVPLYLLLLLVSLLVLLRGPICLSQVWTNAGWTVLSQAQVTVSGKAWPQALLQAEALLRQATVFASQNRAAWRGLGFVLATQGREDEAMVAWRNVEGIAEEFLLWGERARGTGRYEEALTWYERIAEIEPGSGDSWYYMGLAYEGMGRWEKALEAYQIGLSLPLVEIGQSDLYYRVGWLQSRKIDPPDLEAGLVALSTAIAQHQFVERDWEVQAHYQRAETLRQLGLREEASWEYEWVIARQPEHWQARVQLGTLYWQIERDPKRAEAMLLTAISLKPDVKWAYRGLAQVYQETGRTAEAIEMYKQVLRIDSQDRLALEQLGRLIPSGRN